LTPGGSSTAHIYTHNTQNTDYATYITIKNKIKNGKCRPCPVFASYTLAFALQLRKKHGKTSVRVVAKCPDILVAYSSTHLHTNNTQNGTYIIIRILKLTKEHIYIIIKYI
jgi:RNase P subunit RPR2